MKHIVTAAAVVPILISIGLTIFTRSFFLSRKSFKTRSSCYAAPELLKEIGLNVNELNYLQSRGWLNGEGNRDGCWTPRRIDSLLILVVDALRFDFARDHLPLSVGSRLFHLDSRSNRGGHSRLYQFVADPPTVTMQRLKALTTGGLPTFADITGSFGGANIEEDSWVEQLITTRNNRGGNYNVSSISKIAFVGDDTWVDLFPNQFDDCHPYPSFNTRDLDTVDDGCLMHLPRLLFGLNGLSRNETQQFHNSSNFEVIVAHFLGVDHVGHTYGPNDPHMERKLHQMDLMLSHSLDAIDAAPQKSCVAAFVFGDHGMTEDGNHGGGTNDERNAGLFAHYSSGCQIETKTKLEGREIGIDSTNAFDSINQIDLVPTISLLLGLPIPYANIGGLVPELLPTTREKSTGTPHAAAALALNAAQVWTYFNDYSKTSKDLPINRLKELKQLLDSATLVYKDALADAMKQSEQEESADFNDSIIFRQACSLYKLFLAESTDLGKRVWTQFNEGGMRIGIVVMTLAWIISFPFWRKSARNDVSLLLKIEKFYAHIKIIGDNNNNRKKEQVNRASNTLSSSIRLFRLGELTISAIFMMFHSGILTFGNSYIDSEREVITFSLSILCLLLFRRWYYISPLRDISVIIPLVVTLSTRLNDIFITGHGLDPSIRLHAAHHSLVFISSLLGLAFLRLTWLEGFTLKQCRSSLSLPTMTDLLAIICLAFSWWEKRSRDHSRNGFYAARAAIGFTLFGLIHLICKMILSREGKGHVSEKLVNRAQLVLYRIMMFIVIVTGPSAASTSLVVIVQTASLKYMMESTGAREIDAPVMAAIWRLAIRHVFFATNHHCSFNRLHYSAAFVAIDTFVFHVAGSALFMNTFGWEIIGSILVLLLSRSMNAKATADNKENYTGKETHVWHWFLFYQWTEILSSCISVSLMKRHLMVWAIFAPRFMFAAVFTTLNLIFCLLDLVARGKEDKRRLIQR